MKGSQPAPWSRAAAAIAVAVYAALCLFSAAPPRVKAAEAVESGRCGENVRFTLDSNGVLTLSGTGAMFGGDREPYALRFENGNVSTLNGKRTNKHAEGALVSGFVPAGSSKSVYLNADPSFLVAAFFYDDALSYLGYRSNLRGGAVIDLSAVGNVSYVRFTAHKAGFTALTPAEAVSVAPVFDGLPDGNADGGNKTGLPAMLTIIDDDGNAKFYTEVYPIVRELNVPIATAVIASKPDTGKHYMTWDQISEMHRNGVEVLNHTYSHYLSSDPAFSEAKEADLAAAYSKARDILKEKGIENDLIVFSGSTGRYSKSRRAARRAGFLGGFLAGDNEANTPGADRYQIQRYRIGSDYPWNVDTLKGLVDLAVQKGGWSVWMFHTSDGARWTDFSKDVLRQVCAYAKDAGLPIVTAKAGFQACFGDPYTRWSSAAVRRVVIEDGVTDVGAFAFCDSGALESVTLPKSVKSVGAFAFRGCAALAGAQYAGTAEDWCGVDVSPGNGALTDALCVTPPADPFLRGDADSDGDITSADARLALRRAVEIETYAEGSAEYRACDANGDGEVTAADARLILRKAVGLTDPEFKA